MPLWFLLPPCGCPSTEEATSCFGSPPSPLSPLSIFIPYGCFLVGRCAPALPWERSFHCQAYADFLFWCVNWNEVSKEFDGIFVFTLLCVKNIAPKLTTERYFFSCFLFFSLSLFFFSLSFFSFFFFSFFSFFFSRLSHFFSLHHTSQHTPSPFAAFVSTIMWTAFWVCDTCVSFCIYVTIYFLSFFFYYYYYVL